MLFAASYSKHIFLLIKRATLSHLHTQRRRQKNPPAHNLARVFAFFNYPAAFLGVIT